MNKEHHFNQILNGRTPLVHITLNGTFECSCVADQSSCHFCMIIYFSFRDNKTSNSASVKISISNNIFLNLVMNNGYFQMACGLNKTN